jgi:hypothetical protein
MVRFRLPVTLAFAALLVADVVVAFRLWGSGWPKEITLTSPQPGVEQVKVIAVPFTLTDWSILLVVIAIHAALGFLAWSVAARGARSLMMRRIGR